MRSIDVCKYSGLGAFAAEAADTWSSSLPMSVLEDVIANLSYFPSHLHLVLNEIVLLIPRNPYSSGVLSLLVTHTRIA